jgi:hypothetical protein
MSKQPDRRSIMKYRSKTLGLFLFACAFLLTSCATTTLTTVWKDEAFHGPVKKVVVVGAFRRPTARNLFEDEFARQLKAHGVEAIASYTIVPIDELSEKDLLMDRIRETGADAALVTRMVDKKTVESYVPGQVYVVPRHYRRWGTYFDYIYTPGYMVREEYAYAETNIYETNSGDLIWSAMSRTLLSGEKQDLIRSFVNTMVGRMAGDNLIP